MKKLLSKIMILVCGAAIGVAVGLIVESTLGCYMEGPKAIVLVMGALIGLMSSIIIFFNPLKYLRNILGLIKYSIFKRHGLSTK